MATYLVQSSISITRHEGDIADVVFTIPNPPLDITGYGVRFWVKDSSGRTIIRKDTVDATITVAGQLVTIPLLPADTKGHAGKHSWESEIYDINGPITIGYGPFVINAELIR